MAAEGESEKAGARPCAASLYSEGGGGSSAADRSQYQAPADHRYRSPQPGTDHPHQTIHLLQVNHLRRVAPTPARPRSAIPCDFHPDLTAYALLSGSRSPWPRTLLLTWLHSIV